MLEDLKNIVIDESQNLEKLKLYLSQPNYMEIFGISHRELQHSNFLSWMLNSKASHNIGNYFLKSFINLLPISPEDKIRINLSNLENTKIHREYNDIDLLIVNDKLNFTIYIENKIKSGKSGENQLLKYYEIVENIWSDKEHKNYYVYLTPFPRTLTDKEIEIDYKNLTYQSILDILKDTIKSKQPSDETKPLIEHYIRNLEKNIMGISKEAKLAQEIYRKHKSAIDFIVSNKPSLYSKGLFNQINDFFKNHDSYQNLTPKDKNIIRILPNDIVPYFDCKTNSWGDTTSSFALELFCEQERIWMKFCYGAVKKKDYNENSKLQKIKDENFNKMKDFSSISRKVARRSKSSSNYPSVANFDIIKITDKVFMESDDVFTAFVEKFKKFEESTLNKWANEVKEKITKTQQWL